MIISKVNLDIYTRDRLSNIIEWDVQSDDASYRNLIVEISVSESPEDGFKTLGSTSILDGIYIDSTYPTGISKWTTFYYKVKFKLGKKIIKEVIESLNNYETPEIKEMRRRIALTHDPRYNGQPLKIYKIKTYGQRCHCYDKMTRQSRTSNCESCGGTTFIKGISKAIHTSGGITTSDHNFQLLETGNFENSVIQLSIGNFPLLRPGDLVYSNKGLLYTITNVRPVERQGATVKQLCTLVIENKGSQAWEYIKNAEE